MALQNYIGLVGQAEFQNKIRFYLIKAAVSIMNEAGSTANHQKRVDYAQEVLAGSVNLDDYCRAVLQNATIQGKVDAGTDYDGDLEFAINENFNAFAGVYNPVE